MNNSIKKKSLIEWANSDDACDIKKDGTIVSYHCTDNGIDELDYIIKRLRTLYASGGAVQKITIEPAQSVRNDTSSTSSELITGTKDALDRLTIRAT